MRVCALECEGSIDQGAIGTSEVSGTGACGDVSTRAWLIVGAVALRNGQEFARLEGMVSGDIEYYHITNARTCTVQTQEPSG